MSLCPNYCECEPCEHGRVAAHWEDCSECSAPFLRARTQQEYEASVARQKMKIKVAPWRKEEEEVQQELEELKNHPHDTLSRCPICVGRDATRPVFERYGSKENG